MSKGDCIWLCRGCVRFKAATAHGMEVCTAVLEGLICRSPIFSGSFEHYQGPVTDLTRFCFICGELSRKTIKARGSDRKFGICEDHGPAFIARTIAHLKECGEQPEQGVLMHHQGTWVDSQKVGYRLNLGEAVKDFERRSEEKYGPDEDKIARMAKQAAARVAADESKEGS